MQLSQYANSRYLNINPAYCTIGMELYITYFQLQKTCTMLPIRYFFVRSIPKNWHAAKLLLSKNHGDLKNEFSFENLQIHSFYFKKHLTKRKWANLFLTQYKKKQFNFIFHFQLLNNLRSKFQVQPLKIKNSFCLFQGNRW